MKVPSIEQVQDLITKQQYCYYCTTGCALPARLVLKHIGYMLVKTTEVFSCLGNLKALSGIRNKLARMFPDLLETDFSKL